MAEALAALEKTFSKSKGDRYYAFYSSLFDGIVQNPSFLPIPLDDHMVHRGDGVFEALRFSNGAIYDLKSHLSRMKRSAEALGLMLPRTMNEVENLILATARASGRKEGSIRVFVSRGPGNFSVNPYDAFGSQIYIAITDLKSLDERKVKNGFRAIFSQIPQKPIPFCQIKHTNYLPNALMKKEAADRGVDFALGLTSEGFVTEGATENVVLLDFENRLKIPRFSYTLEGTTLKRLIEISKKTIPRLLKSVEFNDLTKDDFFSAKEVFMVGTTLVVVSVVEIDGKQIGEGKPGPVGRTLRQMLLEEMSADRQCLTPIGP